MDLHQLVKIFDILASIMTVVSLNLVRKYNQAWILYTVGSILFIVVCVYNKIPGLSLMGVCLLVTGIRNYLLGRTK